MDNDTGNAKENTAVEGILDRGSDQNVDSQNNDENDSASKNEETNEDNGNLISDKDDSDDDDGDVEDDGNGELEPFLNSNGSTFLRQRNNKLLCLFNFTLKKYANVLARNLNDCFEGKWLFMLTTLQDDNQLTTRLIMLDTNSFYGRKEFANKIISQVNNAMVFVTSRVTANILSRYFEWLNSHKDQDVRIVYNAPIIGFQKPDTWVLSNEVQLQGRRKLAALEQQYYISDLEVRKGSLSFNDNLLDKLYLKSLFSKIIQYADGFGVNRHGFLHAISFAIMRLIKSSQDEGPADEARFCCLHSVYKGVGKSQTLMVLAYGQGVENVHNHKYVIGGGDGFLTGMSSKMQQLTFAQTNMLVIVNEICMSHIISGMLNQAHDRLASGSVGIGATTARASIFGSSNQVEHERLEGRMVRISYDEGNYTEENHRILTQLLIPMAKENKGFLVAWCCAYMNYWLAVEASAKAKLHDILLKYMPGRQRRYTRAVAGSILSYFMIHIVADETINPVNVFSLIASDNKTREERSKVTRLAANIVHNLSTSSEKFTWFNPNVSFSNDSRTKHKGFAIRTSKVGELQDVTNAELTSILKPFGKNAWSVNSKFACDPNAKVEDLKKKEKTKNEKSHKVPWKVFNDHVVLAIKSACKGNVIPIKDDNFGISEEDQNELKNIFRDVKLEFVPYKYDCEQRGYLDDVHQQLSPMKRARYEALSEPERQIFRLGRESAK